MQVSTTAFSKKLVGSRSTILAIFEELNKEPRN